MNASAASGRDGGARTARIERQTSESKVVVEVKFTEWTSDHLLRQPIYLGTRDDKAAREVTIEGVSMQRWGTGELKHDAA